MTEPMTMNRLIHGAVRRDLGRLSTGLSQMADGDRVRAQELEKAYANLRRELTHHHEGEDTYIWPMLAKAGVDPDLCPAGRCRRRPATDPRIRPIGHLSNLLSGREGRLEPIS